MKRAWTRGEKCLWAAPFLFGVVALAAKFGPDVARRAMGWPTELQTTPDNTIRSMSLSRNGEVLAAAGLLYDEGSYKRGSGTVYLWNARTGARLPSIAPVYTRDKSGFTNGLDIYALTLSHDAKQIGFSRLSQDWVLYDIATHKQLWSFPSFISDAEFSSDGRFIALSSDSKIFIVDARSGRVQTQWKRSGTANSQDLAVSPDGTVVALIGPYKVNDPIEFYRVSDGKLVRRIPSEGTTSIRFSPDGKRLIAACSLIPWSDKRDLGARTPVRCFDARSGALLWKVKTRELRSNNPSGSLTFCDAIFSPDGRIIAVYQHMEGRVLLLDSTTGKTKKILNLGRAETTQYSVPPALAFSPDGKRLFARGKSAVLIWDLE